MVAKQLPQATFRISDNELWERFKAKAKANGTNASAVFWEFANNYVDGNLASVDGVAMSTLNLDGIDTNLDERIDVALEKKVDFSIRDISRVADEHYERLVAVVAQNKMSIDTRIDDKFSGIQSELTQRDRETEALKLELETIKTAIAALTSEVTVPANFTQALLQRAKEVAPLMDLQEVA